MGMAMVKTYPVPSVKKVYGKWRVTWCEDNNTVWYREFYTWEKALEFTA